MHIMPGPSRAGWRVLRARQLARQLARQRARCPARCPARCCAQHAHRRTPCPALRAATRGATADAARAAGGLEGRLQGRPDVRLHIRPDSPQRPPCLHTAQCSDKSASARAAAWRTCVWPSRHTRRSRTGSRPRPPPRMCVKRLRADMCKLDRACSAREGLCFRNFFRNLEFRGNLFWQNPAGPAGEIFCSPGQIRPNLKLCTPCSVW